MHGIYVVNLLLYSKKCTTLLSSSPLLSRELSLALPLSLPLLSLSLPHFHSLVRSRIAHKGITFHWRRRNRALFLPLLPPLTTRSYSDLVPPPLPLILLPPHCILIWCTFPPFLPSFASPFLSPLPKVGFPHFGWTLSSFCLPLRLLLSVM